MSDLMSCPENPPPVFEAGDIVGCVNIGPGMDCFGSDPVSLRLHGVYTVESTLPGCSACQMMNVVLEGVPCPPAWGGYDTRRFRLISRPDPAALTETADLGELVEA